jgi:hypothetical protein
MSKETEPSNPAPHSSAPATLPEAIVAGYESRRSAAEQMRQEREKREAEEAPRRRLRESAKRFASWSSEVYTEAIQTHGKDPTPKEFLERFLSLTPEFQKTVTDNVFTDFWDALTAAWGREECFWYRAEADQALTVFATAAGKDSFRNAVNLHSGGDFVSLVEEYLFVRNIPSPIRLEKLIYGLNGFWRRQLFELRFPEVKALREAVAELWPDWGFDSPTIQRLVKVLTSNELNKSAVEALPVTTAIEMVRDMLEVSAIDNERNDGAGTAPTGSEFKADTPPRAPGALPEVEKESPPAGAMSEARERGEGGASEFVFEESGNGYYIAGFGEAGHVSDLVGLDTLVRIIFTSVGVSPFELLYEAPKLLDPRSRQPIAELGEIKHWRKEEARLKDEVDTAENDVDREDSQRQLEIIRKQILEAVSVSGKKPAHDLNSALAKNRSAVHDRLKTVYMKMNDADPSMKKLAKHFKASIRCRGGLFRYEPASAPVWKRETKRP